MKRAVIAGLTALAALTVAAAPVAASTGLRLQAQEAAAGPCTGEEAAWSHAGVVPSVPCFSIDDPVAGLGIVAGRGPGVFDPAGH